MAGANAPADRGRGMNVLEHECLIRLGTFFGLLAGLALAERLAPRRPQPAWAGRRLHNLGLAGLNTVAVRLLIPLGAMGMALLAEDRGWGLLHHVSLPEWAAVVLAVVLLDGIIYGQHVLFHAVPVLWRLHRVHHVDHEFDVTTGVRFHTLEILLSAGVKIGAVVALGAPAVAVFVFEVLLNATSMFSHSNLRLPAWVDRVLRLVLVTPDMHRVHHSIHREETDSNFGFNLPWWDYLFGTYRAQPADGHERMQLGVHGWERVPVDRLPEMLAHPFQRGEGEAPTPVAWVAPPKRRTADTVSS